MTLLSQKSKFEVPQVRRAKAHELRQDLAGSSGKCGDRCCGSPGAFFCFSCGVSTDRLPQRDCVSGLRTTDLGTVKALSYTALARKYRPRRFADVATQKHVSETLRRAISDDRVGHAYLFCGPRGVGKTTLARMLAMALNCSAREDSGEPCGECESCTRIWGGQTSLDVVEIDAASNRGVDDARQLRERAMYAPSQESSFHTPRKGRFGRAVWGV